ncbi:MAG: histidinol dehydrogenase [Clostridia bacterium]|nr:histidinol dehydrogenase [Clostridia bacterium]
MIDIIDALEAKRRGIFNRSAEVDIGITSRVADIIADVRQRGDVALAEYTRLYDKCDYDGKPVSKEEIDAAYARCDSAMIDILREAHANIAAFHSRQLGGGFEMNGEDGIVLGQKATPLARVGIYVPGGTASYPSTVLMNATPAKIAGVGEIIMVTPAGRIKDEILIAADIAGVDKIYKVGGAQAIAALAYGTESIAAVDKITGPGNIYVATAKRLVFGQVDIDMIAGPSEVLIVADSSADADCVAADMLSQAEHDRLASSVLVTDDRDLAARVAVNVERRLASLPRAEIAAASISDNGKIIVCDSIDEAIDIANAIAPEHLELYTRFPFDDLKKVRNAGSIFLGGNTPEPVGDYFAGPNHTLPTGGSARFSSPLSAEDFIKRSSYIYYTDKALERSKDKIIAFATSEGLTAHAESVAARFKK